MGALTQTEEHRSLATALELLRCLECGGAIHLVELADDPGYPELGPDGRLACRLCSEEYPLIAGTPRFVDRAWRARLPAEYPKATGAFPASAFRREEGLPTRTDTRSLEDDDRDRTAASFAYEWEHFGALRQEWRQNFLDYMRPLDERFFADRLMLDVGTGSGRHSRQAAELGARVVAVDLGRSIDVARRNLPADVLTVQADALALPFDRATFDLVISIGVLHHLADPQAGLRALARMARPGGRVHVYLYWVPLRATHRAILKLVNAVRRITVRLPHRILHAACYPLSVGLWIGVVLPYRWGRYRPVISRTVAVLPLQTYADYPFGVLLNDQFDRFSAPLERRYHHDEVNRMMSDAGLSEVTIVSNSGWVADGCVTAS